MKRIHFLVALTALALPLFLLGCSTSQESFRTVDTGTQKTETVSGVTVSFQYFNNDALVTLYTTRNNPFIHYRSGTLIAVEVTVQSEDQVELRAGEAEITTAEGTRNSTPKEEIYDYWYGIISRRYDQRRSWLTGTFEGWTATTWRRIEESIFPVSVSVPAAGTERGFIAFDPLNAENRGRRRGGTATMTLPVYGSDGSPLHEFAYQFTIN
jgi:hypothetical protein